MLAKVTRTFLTWFSHVPGSLPHTPHTRVRGSEADLVSCVREDGSPLRTLKVRVSAKVASPLQGYGGVGFPPAGELFKLSLGLRE